jgi:tetratricopeptide (TPR) repeat protein
VELLARQLELVVGVSVLVVEAEEEEVEEEQEDAEEAKTARFDVGYIASSSSDNDNMNADGDESEHIFVEKGAGQLDCAFPEELMQKSIDSFLVQQMCNSQFADSKNDDEDLRCKAEQHERFGLFTLFENLGEMKLPVPIDYIHARRMLDKGIAEGGFSSQRGTENFDGATKALQALTEDEETRPWHSHHAGILHDLGCLSAYAGVWPRAIDFFRRAKCALAECALVAPDMHEECDCFIQRDIRAATKALWDQASTNYHPKNDPHEVSNRPTASRSVSAWEKPKRSHAAHRAVDGSYKYKTALKPNISAEGEDDGNETSVSTTERGIIAYFDSANSLYHAGEKRRAIKYLDKALKLCQKELGKDHPRTILVHKRRLEMSSTIHSLMSIHDGHGWKPRVHFSVKSGKKHGCNEARLYTAWPMFDCNHTPALQGCVSIKLSCC